MPLHQLRADVLGLPESQRRPAGGDA